MTSSSRRTAVLRYIYPDGTASQYFYPLPLAGEIRLGRDPSCEIIFHSDFHTRVSRQHAKILPTQDQLFNWDIYDLGSSNGTYVNRERLHGRRILQQGDCISLGKSGPRFVFELLSLGHPDSSAAGTIHIHPRPPISDERSPALLQGISQKGWYIMASVVKEDNASNTVTFSQLFPIVSTGRELTRKAYLVPGVVTVSFVVLMFVAVGQSGWFNFVLAAYLSSAAYYFVYQLCGRHKPWWVLTGSGLITALLMASPLLRVFTTVFRGFLPGAIPTELESENAFSLMTQMFFGAGLMEELLKAVPVLLGVWVGSVLKSPHRERLGVREPLDGILLGTASAVGFTLMETLGQYVPAIIDNVRFHPVGVSGELLGLQILIPRILGSVSGHMAYSGYLGYFIGLSVLKPKHRWRTLLIGYLSASLLHALWNTTGFINPIILALVGVLSYAFLAAAILKARDISPTREENFATRLNNFRS